MTPEEIERVFAPPSVRFAGKWCRCGCSAERHEEKLKSLGRCSLCDCDNFVEQESEE